MALLGCNVITTDQIEVLPLLKRNVEWNTSRISQMNPGSGSARKILCCMAHFYGLTFNLFLNYTFSLLFLFTFSSCSGLVMLLYFIDSEYGY